MPRPKVELLEGDEAANRIFTLAGSYFERRTRSRDVYCKFDTEQSYLAEVSEFYLRLSDECDMMILHVVLEEITNGTLETWEVPMDDRLTILVSCDMHIIRSPLQLCGLKLLIGDHDL